MRISIVFAAVLLLMLPFACRSSKRKKERAARKQQQEIHQREEAAREKNEAAIRSKEGVDFEVVKGMKVGQATKADVRAAMGEPKTVEKGEQGIETWGYSYVTADVSGWFKTRVESMMKLAIFTFQGETLADLQWMLQNITGKGAWFSGEAGSPVGVEAMNALEKGVATPKEVETKFGVPAVRLWRHDGIEVWTYVHVKSGKTTTGTVTFRNGVLTAVKTEQN